MKKNIIYPVAAVLLGLSACGHDDDDDNSNSASALDNELRALIDTHDLIGDPTEGLEFAQIESSIAQLGMKLFFSKALGGAEDAACASCHHPMLGGGDALSLPIGVDAVQPDLLGPGRTHQTDAEGFDGGPTVPRNSPTTFNMALWQQKIFWDGRIEKQDNGVRTPDSAFGSADPAALDLVSAQARFPVTSHEEMRGFEFEDGNDNDAVRDHLAARLGDFGVGAGELTTNTWVQEFEDHFGPEANVEDLVTYENISVAIAAYERSQVFVDTPWKDYVDGDNDAISDSAKSGAVAFFTTAAEGGAGCFDCHSGDFFTDEGFHVTAMPQVGRGKGDGGTADNDFGRFRETGVDADRFAFRTPSLLNVTATGPWGHAGSFTSLEALVRYHINPAVAFESYDYDQLDATIQITNTDANTRAALAQLETLQTAETSKLNIITDLSDTALDTMVTNLLAFLETLTDPCVLDRECLAPWIPDDETDDPDGMRLDPIDQNGDPL